jgi:protein transport protein SEC61 subunit gamma-like protein
MPWSRMSDYLTSLLEVPRKFTKESTQLLQRCTKPDKRGTRLESGGYRAVEFIKIAQAVGMGFVLMGFIGYFIKLIHIPINNIIV